MHKQKDAYDSDVDSTSPYDDAGNINGGNPYMKTADSEAVLPGPGLQEIEASVEKKLKEAKAAAKEVVEEKEEIAAAKEELEAKIGELESSVAEMGEKVGKYDEMIGETTALSKLNGSMSGELETLKHELASLRVSKNSLEEQLSGALSEATLVKSKAARADYYEKENVRLRDSYNSLYQLHNGAK